MNKIALGTDHAGFRLKEKIKAYLLSEGYQVIDYGTYSETPVDYPDYICPAAESVSRKETDLGVVLGGSGNGEAIVANKVNGIRCAVCWNRESARLAREHNDANVIAIGARMVSEDTAVEIVDTWLKAEFQGGRHQRRLEKIESDLSRIRELEQELEVTREHLQDTVEELETSSEKLQSLNEKLQSSNGELQASNEELNTVNDELHAKSEEAADLLEELKVSEKRYRLLVDNMNEGIMSCEIEYGPRKEPTDLIITQADQTFQELIGIKSHEFPVRAVLANLHELVTKDMLACFVDISQGGAPQRFELYFSELEKRLTVSVYNLDDGRLGMICHDDTDHKRAEDALKEREARYRELVQNANSAIIRWKVDGTVAFFNEYAQEFFGYEENEIIGKDVRILLPGQESSGKDLSGLVQDIIASPERFVNNVNENVCRDGRRVWMAWTNKPILGENGDVKEILAVGADITERYRADMLEESNQRLRDFVHAASHDLQEPLRKIQTFADLIVTLYRNSLDEQACHHLDRLQQLAANMQSLVLALLEYARVTSCPQDLKKFNLREPIEDVIADLSLLLEEKEGQVKISNLPNVHADRIQMYQLFQNLIGNSLKFSGPEKPVIRIYAGTASKGFCKIVVEDNGIGFDERYIDQIFRPFKRLHPKNSPYEGTGIGLAICQRIVERHGGEITAKSRPGKGTTFSVMLPEKQLVKEN